MIKTIFGRLFIGFLTFFVLFLSLSFSFAQEDKSATPSAQAKVEYTLPYPGILPDHPLYFLKMIRDRALGWFIADPVKKSEYNLLMADKRLNSGVFLLEKGKASLAESTFSKGENYLEQAVDEAQKAQTAGRDTQALMSKFSLAAMKHQEVLEEVLTKVPDPAKPGIQSTLEKTQKVLERVREMQKTKLEQRLRERMLGRKTSGIQVEAKGEDGK